MSNFKNHLIIATRQSQLAMRQAEMVRDALLRAHPALSIDLLPLSTAGDRDLTSKPAQWGLKGMFTKEIEVALLDGRADLAVHSMKDMPSVQPDGLMIGALLEREDARDALLSPRYGTLEALPEGAKVGCSSIRRSLLLSILRPDVQIAPFRGNVNTRLAKLDAGEIDATLLAVAGLKRLGLEHRITETFETDTMLPAVAQGAIGIECRSDDAAVRELLASIHHQPTHLALLAERALMQQLDGSCQTPLAGHAIWENDRLRLRGLIIHPQRRELWQAEQSFAPEHAETIGRQLAEKLIEQSGWRHWQL